MSSKNMQEEYSTINKNNEINKNKKDERNNRFYLSKPSFLKKSRITSFLLYFKKEHSNKSTDGKVKINNYSNHTSLSIRKRNNDKILSKKRTHKMRKTSTSITFAKNNKYLNNNNIFKNNQIEYSSNTINYTLNNYLSLNTTSKSFYKDPSKMKTKSLNKEKNNKNRKNTYTISHDKKKNGINDNISKNKSYRIKKDTILKNKITFANKEYPLNHYKTFNNKFTNGNSNKVKNDVADSACLTDRYQKKIIDKGGLTERRIYLQKFPNENKFNTIKQKKYILNDLKSLNESENHKKLKDGKKTINNHKKLSILLNNILTDKINNSSNTQNSQKNDKSKDSEKNINNNYKTQDNINYVNISTKYCDENNIKHNSSRKKNLKYSKENISKLSYNHKDKNIDCNKSMLRSTKSFVNRKKDSFNSIRNKIRLNGVYNILTYNNGEKKEILSHCNNSKSLFDKSKITEYVNFTMINNETDVTKESNNNEKNKSNKKENLSRNKKECNNLTNTNSINLENNNTNYISPKQYEIEENTTNSNTPLVYNNIYLMTMNNINKKILNNKNNLNKCKKKQKNNNIINKNMPKKKINHNKRLSIPNISNKNIMISEKKEFLEKTSSKFAQNQTAKEKSFVKKIKINKNIPKIPIIKKIIKIDSCSVRGYSDPDTPKINQDNYFIIKDFLNNPEHFFIGLCDGHGSYGQLVSKYICDILPKKMTNLSYEIMSEAILSANKSLIEESKIDCSLSGSTCNTLLIYPEKLICANVGDTRAVLARYENGQYNAINLSRDHKPKELDEMKRIINSNGRIKQYTDPKSGKAVGPEKIWLKNSEIPGISISRSLGDNLAHTIGVISEPEIKIIEFNGSEKYILLASEGIWKYIDSDESVKIIIDYYENNMDAVGAINTLVKEAFQRWKNEEDTMDDITAILIFFE